MAIYAIGDLQGCYDPFLCLLKAIRFNPDRDQLWLAGDLVNRGPKSLATLQHCYHLKDNLIAVLGNHDLHLLAVALGHTEPKAKDTFAGILGHKQADQLLEWLLECPLLHENQQWVMAHAGIYPGWNLTQARQHASEIEKVLRSPNLRSQFFNNMYGNEPSLWSEDLAGPERWRMITNSFTRMRLLDHSGHLDLLHKDSLDKAPPGMVPWFRWPNRVKLEKTVLFGHWAALEGNTETDSVIALDTGCVWGNKLTALCLNDRVMTSCNCN